MYELTNIDEILINNLLTNYGSKLIMFNSLKNVHNKGGFQSECYMNMYDIVQSLDESCIRYSYQDLNLTDYKRATIIKYLRNLLFIFEQLPDTSDQILVIETVINRLTFDANVSKYSEKYHYDETISSMTVSNKLTAIQLYKNGMIEEFYNYLFLNESVQNLLAFKGLEYLDASLLLCNRADIIILEELDCFIDSLLENKHSNFSLSDKKIFLMNTLNYLRSFNFITDEIFSYLVGLDLESASTRSFISKIGVSSEYARSQIKSLIY